MNKEEIIKLLDWRIGEEKYIKECVNNYLKEQAKMPLGFMISKKTLNKNIKKVSERAKEEFREQKLMIYEMQILEERERINNIVEDINYRFNVWLKEQGSIIDNKKLIKIKARNIDEPLSIIPTEIVRIKSEPFDICFIQEKLEGKNNE